MYKLIAKTLADGVKTSGCRRAFPRHLQHRTTALAIAAIAVIFSLAFCADPIEAESTDRPNIVFILADDLGYRELGSFGQQRIKTPHLDRLAREGMRLTQHYAGNAV